jgi:hypothetical protein
MARTCRDDLPDGQSEKFFEERLDTDLPDGLFLHVALKTSRFGSNFERGILARVPINRARLERLDRCPFCPDSEQFPHHVEMTRCANSGSAGAI